MSVREILGQILRDYPESCVEAGAIVALVWVYVESLAWCDRRKGQKP